MHLSPPASRSVPLLLAARPDGTTSANRTLRCRRGRVRGSCLRRPYPASPHVSVTLRPMDDESLLQLAEATAANSIVPVSRRASGAALLSTDGAVFVGARIETSNLADTVCAAQVALNSALAAGKRQFDKVAIFGLEADGRLCGRCRHLFRSFAPSALIVGVPRGTLMLGFGLPRCAKPPVPTVSSSVARSADGRAACPEREWLGQVR